MDKFIDEYHYIRDEKLSTGKHARHHQYHESENIDRELIKMKSNVKITRLRKFLDIPSDIMSLMNLRKMKKQCNQLHEEIKERIRQKQQSYFNEELEEDLNAEQKEKSKR